MKRAAALAAGLAVLALAGAGGFAVYRFVAPSQPLRPDFTLADLQGQPRSIDEFDGDVVLVNFWATWCAPCRQEIPMLVDAQRDYRDQGLRILGIAVDTRGAATQFADRYHINYPVLADPAEGARVQDAYTGGDAPAGVLPYTVIVDRDGHIVTRIAGALDRAALERLVKPLLARSPAKTDGA